MSISALVSINDHRLDRGLTSADLSAADRAAKRHGSCLDFIFGYEDRPDNPLFDVFEREVVRPAGGWLVCQWGYMDREKATRLVDALATALAAGNGDHSDVVPQVEKVARADAFTIV